MKWKLKPVVTKKNVHTLLEMFQIPLNGSQKQKDEKQYFQINQRKYLPIPNSCVSFKIDLGRNWSRS